MSSIRYRRFNRPGFLKKIRIDVLRQFLLPHRDYLESRGLSVTSGPIDCDLLGQILATPDCDTPADLVEALEICDAVCFPETLEELVERDREREHPFLDGEHSHADAVLLTWIHEPDAVERIFNRAALELDRSLVVYQASTPIRPDAFRRRRLNSLQEALRPHFENQLRGPSCRVTVYERPNGGHALVIKHGDPINKTDAIRDNGDAEPIVFRPERIDLAFHDPERNEWRISGRAKWLQTLYSSAFAGILHGEGCRLRRSISYTLEALMEEGLAILDHQTSEIRDVRLTDLQISLSGATVRLSGRNLREAFETIGSPLIEYGEPKSARFAFSLVNRRSALYATIHQGRVSVRGDIDHPAIEDWLTETGFLNTEDHESEVVAGH